MNATPAVEADQARRDALREAAAEELARRDLLEFARLVYPRFESPPHIRHIAGLLQRISTGTGKSIALSIPVRHGKSVLSSQIFPAWHIGRNPTAQVIVASHSESLAVMHSRVAKHLLEDDRWPFLGVELSRDSASVQRWNVVAGGGTYAIGVGGSITGRGFSIGVIDDALHDGLSESESESCWSWFREVFVPRAEPGARFVVIGARLSTNDLIGRIAESDFADSFEFVRLPALAEENDPLGRSPGQPLWPERMNVEEIEQRRAMMGSFAFEAQFQQNPLIRDGVLVKRDDLVLDKEFPNEFDRKILAIDAAATTGVNSDWSACVCVGLRKGEFFVIDVIRQRVELPQLRRLVLNMFAKHNPSKVIVESASAGIGLAQDLRQNTTMPVVTVKPTKSKIARFEGVLGAFESHRVHFPAEASWLPVALDELLNFTGTGSRHDDIVDALTHAISSLQRRAVEWSFAIASNSRTDPHVVGAMGRRLT